MKPLLESLGDFTLPWINDWALGRDVEPLRAEIVAGAGGRVLEIGAGTGLNFQHYRAGVDVTAIEPAGRMRRRAEVRARDSVAHLTLIEGKAGELPFDAGSFDTVLVTFTLCSIRDLGAALAEVKRVLKKGGSLRLLEHVKSPDPRVARLQRALDPAWRIALAGCSLVREPAVELERAGFESVALRAIVLPMPFPVGDGVIGTAIRG
ncbi:MAG: class I SAM-dependent methyltransferase [Byssovorax sp.]